MHSLAQWVGGGEAQWEGRGEKNIDHPRVEKNVENTSEAIYFNVNCPQQQTIMWQL